MFKFLDKLVTVGIIKEQLRTYSIWRPYDDSSYSYSIEGNTTSVVIKFPYRKDLHQKYTLKYDNDTKDFTISPNDLNIKKGSFSYRKIKRALVFADTVIKDRVDFYNSVYKSRKEVSEMMQRTNTITHKSSSDDYSRPKRSKTSSGSGRCIPSMRDNFMSSADSSSSRDSSPSRSNDNSD